MSGADESIYLDPSTEAMLDNEPCWCVECGWDGLEDELMFTNDGVFVCPQCGGEDTDYFYSEDASNCVFCGSHDVIGVIDIVSLNEIHESTPLDKEQVYGYCARCADVKMAEGSTGDQIVSWEDGAGVSSPSMPPSDIKWSEDEDDEVFYCNCGGTLIFEDVTFVKCDKCGATDYQAESFGAESKKERMASGRAMHYAIPSEKKYPIWDKAHGRMALAWSKGTKYADRVEKAVTKRFPTMNAETVYRNYPGRKGPSLSATSVKRGTRKRGNDGKMWEVRKSGRSQRWFRGAESFEALGEPDAPYDQGYDDQQDESLGERNVTTGEQSLKDRRDEADAMDKKPRFKCLHYDHHDYSPRSFEDTTPSLYKDLGTSDWCTSTDKDGTQHGDRFTLKHRDPVDPWGRKYDDVGTMDPKIKFPEEPSARRHWSPGKPYQTNKKHLIGAGKITDVDTGPKTITARAENMGLTQYVGSAGGSSQGTPVSYGGIALPESDVASLVATDNPMDATIGTVTGTMGAEGQSVTPAQYVFDRDNSLEWQIDELKNVGWNSIRSLEKEIEDCYDDEDDEVCADLEEQKIKIWEQIRKLEEQRDSFDNVSFGSEEVPVVPDPSSFPQGYGRVLGQQTDQANLSPLHAEDDEDVQMVKIIDPVMTGAKMAIGVVALNATAIASAALIALAITWSARRDEII